MSWTAQRDMRRRARPLLFVLAGAAALMLLICAGLAPVLLSGLFGGESDDGQQQFQFACGMDIGSLPDIKGLSQEQISNAAVIIAVGRELKIPGKGFVVAIATAMQESTLHNYTHAVDHDSLGLFQQRPTMGWGTPAQVTDPRYSAAKFYERLVRIGGWEQLRVTEAAQRVQRSAFPNAYQKWEHLAVGLVAKLAGDALATIGAPACAAHGEVSASGWTVPTRPIAVAAHGTQNTFVLGGGFRPPDRPNHKGVDLIARRGTPIQAASGGIVITVRCQASIGTCDRDGGSSVKGCGWYVEVAHSGGVWTRYCHMGQRPSVVVGQRVNAGDLLGFVGSSGNSSGPHLHFEVHVGPVVINPVPFMTAHGVPIDARRA